MISEKDITNVKDIIKKITEFEMSDAEKAKFKKLQHDFGLAGDKYLKEVRNHDRV